YFENDSVRFLSCHSCFFRDVRST
ncbi:hypothetical protein VCHENC02_0484B, partial [Vibrio harveyi]